MKKIIVGLLAVLGTWSYGQNYPDYYPSSGNYDNGYYSDRDDELYFPDDYYYEYPEDYYTEDFYRNFYDDYRRSVSQINWNRFFVQHNLAPWQIQQIMYLNEMYPSYTSWNSYYRYNPDRWYYDRFFALQQIMGPQIFVIFQNMYYGGYSPVAYYHNYRIRHYQPVVYVVPRYRNININIFLKNRQDYHRQYGYFYNPKNGIGFEDNKRLANSSVRNHLDDKDRNFSNTRTNEARTLQKSSIRNNEPNRNSSIRNQENSAIRNGASSRESSLQTTPRNYGNSNGSLRNTSSQSARNFENTATKVRQQNSRIQNSRQNYTEPKPAQKNMQSRSSGGQRMVKR